MEYGVALLQGATECGDRVNFLNAGSALESTVNLYSYIKRQFANWGGVAIQYPEKIRFLDPRLQNVYGPDDGVTKFVSSVIRAFRASVPELRATAGEQERDFVHIRDVVRAFDVIISNLGYFAACDTVDTGSGSAIRVRDFFELAQYIAGSSSKVLFGALAYRQNEPMRCVVDITRLRSLGWRPVISLEDGLRDMFSKTLY